MCGDVACAVSHAPEAGPSRGTLSPDLGAAVQVWGDGRARGVTAETKTCRYTFGLPGTEKQRTATAFVWKGTCGFSKRAADVYV